MNNKQPLPLPADSLYRHCDPATLPFGDTTELEHLDNYYGQDRALDALRFGLGIRHEGYNIYVLGSSGMGKHEMLQDFLHQQTFDRPKPSDWCYVNNFSAPHQPKVLRLPCGLAQHLRKDMEQCIEDLLVTIPGVFQSAEYKARLNDITDAFNDQEQQAFSELKEKSKARNISMLETPSGYTLAPLVNDKIITSEEFEALSDDEKTAIEQKINELKEELKGLVQKMPMWVKASREQFKKLNQSIVQNAVGQIFRELQNRYADYPDVVEFLALVKQDVIENVDAFREEEERSSVPENLKNRIHEFPMYRVNVLVDNGGEARIESIDQLLSLVSTKSLEPEPVPLDIKVILLGDRTVYYLLQAYDPDFNLLFKVPADLSEELPRTDANTLGYARLIASLQHRKGIRPLDQSAVARVVEQGSRLLEDAQKLPLHLNLLTDLLCESDYFAGQASAEQIGIVHVQAAIEAASRRMDQFRERVHESILREIQLVDTRGEHVAQINGLSVYQLGEYTFGRPTRITAQARLGHGKVLDIEREVKLGGNIHSKAVLILSAFIANRYARDRPLPVSASLVFEQSYGGIEGDSASVAEIAVLLSAIADIPIRQSLAVTGSTNQHGQVQAIGGINQKIEGFYDICNARGLTDDQGVVMPAANTQHLMLEERVIDAVKRGAFHIYAISTIDEALTLLTGLPAGEPDDKGEYPADSVNGKVMAKIEAWIQVARKFAVDNTQGDDRAD